MLTGRKRGCITRSADRRKSPATDFRSALFSPPPFWLCEASLLVSWKAGLLMKHSSDWNVMTVATDGSRCLVALQTTDQLLRFNGTPRTGATPPHSVGQMSIQRSNASVTSVKRLLVESERPSAQS
ncbi:unnamed protein product [Protopolystoma xenopodis]|uniref:Uncharacterized protein n=1 Tax=Protopolystoma xenopodis TaxID=117903 RepID=A0A3S5A7F4_9PLAT|nr:unnamed protein product [Protopolystoma xenopodis]